MSVVQAVPVDQRLTLLGIVTHAKPVVEVFLFLMFVMLIAAVVVWAMQLAGRRDPERGEGVLSTVLVTAPLFGLTAAAYGLMDMSIGIANVRPAPDLTVLAPGFAEAGLCILLGLLAASLAAAFRAHLRFASGRQSAA
ncbi:MotA/TolQ/ExbB proton channel family protein [Phenylobacterium sp.]|uniref:MotA/TolQ/ExbB proton channel family protein n=1 Tax=Phenylobacterium sp. TaxID=1871053 RepID=UPI002DE289FD|nr:MotA/TolQ/ExbB proton channel family protein [Phenylobacterium sp.]